MTHQYTITGMTCGSCTAKVKNELLKTGDITSADIQLASPQASISMSRHISTNSLQQIISRAGNFKISDLQGHEQMQETDAADNSSYKPILLIFAYITGITFLIQFASGQFVVEQWMTHFMAGFFLVFSFFKLMNLRGFADGYQLYDVLAKKWPAWGFIYPFIELGIGIALLLGIAPLAVNLITAIVMALSLVGVINSLLKKQQIQCACLGTVIKLPLGKVTLFEDSLMLLMSVAMLAMLN